MDQKILENQSRPWGFFFILPKRCLAGLCSEDLDLSDLATPAMQLLQRRSLGSPEEKDQRAGAQQVSGRRSPHPRQSGWLHAGSHHHNLGERRALHV